MVDINRKRIAVVLSNLGGPDSLDAVEPFLFNLFYDNHIIAVPNPFRYFLAKRISKKRAPVAKEIYRLLGNKSPIFDNTKDQAIALQNRLDEEHDDYKVFVMMSYWHPLPKEVIAEVNDFSPQEVILLPLYPQYSTTTTLSSIDSLKGAFPLLKVVCCYYDDDFFITAHCSLLRKYYEKTMDKNPKVLFSAHGLPKKIIKKGDPYEYQVCESARLIAEASGIENLDWKVCYQSKVGREEWLEPSTEEEIVRAGKEGRHVLIVPIAFVSEHSETLIELDIEYKDLAKSGYTRVPALGDSSIFIECLRHKVLNLNDRRSCPARCTKCWNRLI